MLIINKNNFSFHTVSLIFRSNFARKRERKKEKVGEKWEKLGKMKLDRWRIGIGVLVVFYNGFFTKMVVCLNQCLNRKSMNTSIESVL